jgi:hypothetical protein
MLVFLLNNVDSRADNRSFGKLLLEMTHLGSILLVIQVNGSLKFLNI